VKGGRKDNNMKRNGNKNSATRTVKEREKKKNTTGPCVFIFISTGFEVIHVPLFLFIGCSK
jgi:hypothetical protein